MFWHARGLEMAACPAKLADTGGRTPSNAMAALSGAGMIEDFRLWGSRRCRQTNAPPKKPWWRVQVARDFDNHNAFLSEGGALVVVVERFPEMPGGDGGPGEGSPVSGFEGAEPLASPSV